MSKVIVITGASSGIGEATARRLARGGHRVVLGARSRPVGSRTGAETTVIPGGFG